MVAVVSVVLVAIEEMTGAVEVVVKVSSLDVATLPAVSAETTW